jgi:hypothetical protein
VAGIDDYCTHDPRGEANRRLWKIEEGKAKEGNKKSGKGMDKAMSPVESCFLLLF